MKVCTEYSVFLFIFSIIYENVNSQHPKNLKAEPLNEEIKVTWSPPSGTNPSHYMLLIQYPTGQRRQYNASDTIYFVRVNNNFGTYLFAVQAYYTNGLITSWTPFVSLKIDRATTSSMISSVRKIKQTTTVSSTPAPPITPDIEQIRHPIVGLDHLLTCNPGRSTVLRRYQWKVNDQIIRQDTNNRFMVNESKLTIRNITKSDKNTVVQCRFSSTRGQSKFSPVFTLNPSYGPTEVFLEPPQQLYTLDENERLHVSVLCSADCYPQCKIEWKYKQKTSHDFNSLQLWQSRLTISNINRDNAGTYRCFVTSPDPYILSYQMKDVELNVNYGPDLNLNPPATKYDIPENGNIGPIKCSAECYPKCSTKWRFKPIGGTLADFGDDQRLEIRQITRSESGEYQCVAQSINDQRKQDSILVNVVVHYGPYNITLVPFRDNITVVEKSIIGGIKCSAECGPNCKIYWRYNNMSNIYSDTIFNTKANYKHNGAYRCAVLNNHPTGNRTLKLSRVIRLNVLHGPKRVSVVWKRVNSQRLLKIDKGHSIGLIRCTAVCKPECNYTWQTPNSENLLTGQSIDLGLSKRNHTGNYSCIVTNEYGSAKYNFEIIVQEFGIENQNTSLLISSPLKIAEGTQLALVCRAKCRYSSCNYRWEIKRGRSSSYKDEAILHFHKINIGHTGTYTCYDMHTQEKQMTYVIVLYQPKISKITLRNNIGKLHGRYELKEGKNLMLSCSVKSIPLSNISWTRANDNLLLKADRNCSNSTYTVEKSSCNDSNTYICEATNGIGSVVKKNITINIRCSPRESTTHRTMRTDSFEREEGSNVSFTVNAIGYPVPEIEWFYKYNVSSHKKKLTPTNRMNFTRLGEQFCLNIGILDANDFGMYLLELSNTEGNITFNFSLQAKVRTKSTAESNGKNSSDLGQIIGVIIAVITLMVSLVIALIVVMYRRKAISRKDSPEADGVRRDGSDQLGHGENSEMSNQKGSHILRENNSKALTYDNHTYSSSTKNGTVSGENHPPNDKTKARHSYTYAEVHKSSHGTKAFNVVPASEGKDGPMDYTYAKVVKCQEKHEKSKDDETSRTEKASSSNTSHSRAGKKKKPKKKDELNYVDVDVSSPGKESKSFVIHGLENRTAYSLIDFTKHADPLPDSDDENNRDDKQNTSDNNTEEN